MNPQKIATLDDHDRVIGNPPTWTDVPLEYQKFPRAMEFGCTRASSLERVHQRQKVLWKKGMTAIHQKGDARTQFVGHAIGVFPHGGSDYWYDGARSDLNKGIHKMEYPNCFRTLQRPERLSVTHLCYIRSPPCYPLDHISNYDLGSIKVAMIIDPEVLPEHRPVFGSYSNVFPLLRSPTKPSPAKTTSDLGTLPSGVVVSERDAKLLDKVNTLVSRSSQHIAIKARRRLSDSLKSLEDSEIDRLMPSQALDPVGFEAQQKRSRDKRKRAKERYSFRELSREEDPDCVPLSVSSSSEDSSLGPADPSITAMRVQKELDDLKRNLPLLIRQAALDILRSIEGQLPVALPQPEAKPEGESERPPEEPQPGPSRPTLRPRKAPQKNLEPKDK